MPSPTKSPSIVLRQTDADRLSLLSMQMEASAPVVANLLLNEIARAKIKPDHLVKDTIVGMHSMVEFEDDAHGRRRTVQLVYPSEADISANRISIMTPVGAGLIGLSLGQSILWPNRDGRDRVLTILKVTSGALEPAL